MKTHHANAARQTNLKYSKHEKTQPQHRTYTRKLEHNIYINYKHTHTHTNTTHHSTRQTHMQIRHNSSMQTQHRQTQQNANIEHKQTHVHMHTHTLENAQQLDTSNQHIETIKNKFVNTDTISRSHTNHTIQTPKQHTLSYNKQTLQYNT